MKKCRVVFFVFALVASVVTAGPQTVEEVRVQIQATDGHLVVWAILPNALAEENARCVFLGGGNWEIGNPETTSARIQGLAGGSFGDKGPASPILNARAWLNFHGGTAIYFEVLRAFERHDPSKLQFEGNLTHPVPIKGLHWLSLGGATEQIFKESNNTSVYAIRASPAFSKRVLVSGIFGKRSINDKSGEKEDVREFVVRAIIQFRFNVK